MYKRTRKHKKTVPKNVHLQDKKQGEVLNDNDSAEKGDTHVDFILDKSGGRYMSEVLDGKDITSTVTVLGEHSDEEDEGERLLKQVVLGGDSDLIENGLAGTEHPDYPEKKKRKTEKAPVWEDEEDETVEVKVTNKLSRVNKSKNKQEVFVGKAYQENLKAKFLGTVGDTSWARLKWQREDEKRGRDHDDDEDDPETSELLRSTGNYLESSESLAKGCIQMEKCTAANKQSPTLGCVTSVEFHPTAQVMLTAGADHRLNIFQVDGKDNPKIQSVFVEQFPISSAHFTRDGTEVVIGSQKKRGFYYYDMMEGKIVKVQSVLGLEEPHLSRFVMSPDGKYIVFLGHYGRMHFISTKSKEWIDTVKMNGQVNSVAFNNDGSRMYSHGSDGQVYIWDVNSRSCVHKFTDNGTINGQCIAASNNGRYLATGCESGIVNVYDASKCETSSDPQPLSLVKNLVTKCSSALFNPTTEILAVASKASEKAVKLVHLPSMTAFSNFPDRTDRLRFPTCMDFSLNSGYFCVGDNKGSAHLYRVKHYSNY